MNDESISIEYFTSDDELEDVEEFEEKPILYLIKTRLFAVLHFA